MIFQAHASQGRSKFTTQDLIKNLSPTIFDLLYSSDKRCHLQFDIY